MNRTIRFHELGGPEVLRVEDIPVADPGPGEVGLAIQSIGLNRAEAMYRRGQYLEVPQLPSRLGLEAAGVVISIGKGVSDFKEGDRVATIPSHSMGKYGVYSDRAVVPAASLVKYPANLTFGQAAASYTQYLTAYFAFVDIGNLEPNQHLLITAASSSTGVAALQLARILGVKTIATTRMRGKSFGLRNAGADEVVVTSEENLVERVMNLTNGRGVDMIYDPVAGNTLPMLAESVAWGGQIILYGGLDDNPTIYPLRTGFVRNFSLRTYMIYNYTGLTFAGLPRLEDAYRRAVDFVDDALSSGRLSPIIAKTFSLDSVVEAHQYLESNQQLGKILMTTT